MHYLRQFVVTVRSVGLRAAITYLFAERFHTSTSGSAGTSVYRIHPREAQYPLYCRRGSSDRHCFRQIFVDREYQFLNGSEDPKVIVDCGANVGFSTAYFMSRFPQARVIAIEPDERNVEMLRRNTALYGDRVTILHSAVWSRPKGLVVSKGAYRDGREWATQVRECQDGEEADLRAIDIGSLFGQFGFEQIDILKMDIERAELAVFSENFESWVNRVRTFIIEIHDEKCRDTFLAALAEGHFEFSSFGELTVARRVPPS